MAKPLWRLLVTETRVLLIPVVVLIDPQIDGLSFSIHQPSSGERELLLRAAAVSALVTLKPLDSEGLLIIGCHSQIDPSHFIHQVSTQKLKQPPKVSKITRSY